MGAKRPESGWEADARRAAELPFEVGIEAPLVERYEPQLSLPEVGVAGQRRLGAARVLLIGAGGLGSSAALYLAGAGVGTLGVVDGDVVERSNLHRQVLHGERHIGCPKTESAVARLRDLNPEVRLVAHASTVGVENAREMLEGWDLVIDGSDNLRTRYLVNDTCLELGLPLVYGAATAFEGQVTVFFPGEEPGAHPCFRCLRPQVEGPAAAGATDPGSPRDCSASGVLGTVPGVVGLLQATEALKWLLAIGRSLRGRLLLMDLLAMEFRTVALPPRPGCRCCAIRSRSRRS